MIIILIYTRRGDRLGSLQHTTSTPMTMKKTLLKAAFNITSLTLMAGIVLAIGFLSYCGMLVIYPSVFLAWIAFLLAGLVEGEVYKQNISKGIENLKLLGSKGLSLLIIRHLDHALKEIEDVNSLQHALLIDYHSQKKYCEAFQHKQLTATQKQNKIDAEKRLRRMQKRLAKLIAEKNISSEYDLFYADPIIKSLRDTLPRLKRKRWIIQACVPFCILSGIGFGFATASAFHIAIFVSMSALSPFIWPLAAFAAIGYTFLIYRTISDMIANDTLKKWYQRAKHWFKRKEMNGQSESQAKHLFRVLGISFLILATLSIGILATLATAGTWWLAVKEGVALLPYLTHVAIWIRNILVPIAGLTTLFFIFRNSLKSIKHLVITLQSIQYRTLFSNLVSHIAKKCLALYHDFNPFRLLASLIATPFKLAVFMGHLIATGLTGDRTPGLNYEATLASAAIGAVSDGLVDAPYLTQHEHTKKSGHHEHHVMLDSALKIVLSPLYFLATLWDYVKSRIHMGTKKSDPSAVSFHTLLLKNFDIQPDPSYKENNPHQPSDVWMQEEIRWRFEKHLKAANKNDKHTLEQYRDKLLMRYQNDGSSPQIASLPIKTSQLPINQHNGPRLFCSRNRKQNETNAWINRMICSYSK